LNFQKVQECTPCRLYLRISRKSRSGARLASILLAALVVVSQPIGYLASLTSRMLNLALRRERWSHVSQLSRQPDASWHSQDVASRIAVLAEACLQDISSRGKRLDYPMTLLSKVQEIEEEKSCHRFSCGDKKGSLVNLTKHRFNLETMLVTFLMFLAFPVLWLIARRERDPRSIIFLSSEGHVVAPTRVRCYQFCEQVNEACPEMSCNVLAFYDHYLKNKGFLVDPSYFPAGRLSWRLLRYLLRSGHGVIVHQRPDYDFLVTLIAKWVLGKRIKLVVDIDDFTFPQKSQLVLSKLFYVASFVDILAPWADGFVLSSRHLMTYVQNRYPYHAPYLLPTFPGRLFLSSVECSEDSSRSGPVIFTWVGTLHHPENLSDVLFLLRAWLVADLEDAELHILGGGFFYTLLKLVLDGLEESNNLRIGGWVQPDKMPGYLAGVDVGLYCLTIDNDFMRSKSPTKLFEYWAYGKAVVSTSLGEAGYFVENEKNGILADSVEEMAQAFRRLAADKDLRRRLGQTGRRQVVAQWNQEAVCRCYSQMLEERRD
jgi:glycosyltransferase involved in cell wall biosynthesis